MLGIAEGDRLGRDVAGVDDGAVDGALDGLDVDGATEGDSDG